MQGAAKRRILEVFKRAATQPRGQGRALLGHALRRLATTIPPPRLHVVRYSGVLASAAKLRPLIVPPAQPPADADPAKPANKPPTHRCAYIPWAILAKKTFKQDIDRCPKCGGKMKLKSLVQEPENIARFLRHLGEPTEPPPLAVPSGPRACPPCPCPTRLRRARRRRGRPPTGRFASCAASPKRRPKCSTPSPTSRQTVPPGPSSARTRNSQRMLPSNVTENPCLVFVCPCD
jgi:hypothetical protein